ncbi:MAG: flavodoxin FldA [Paraprevotella sp.]|nr:flavodoxin FldA [Paraprevotella sp.]
MKKISIYYGSTTGTCEALASMIANSLGVANENVHNVTDMTKEDLESSDVLVLGSSTWGCGDLQDDWYDGVDILKTANLSGKKVALFACGDCESYSDTFCEAMTHIHDALANSGCTFIGKVPTSDYTFTSSTAVEGDQFIGLALDDVNESDKSEARIANWAKQIKEEIT